MNITKLYRAKEQPDASTTAANTTGSEIWHLVIDEFARPIQANLLLKELSVGNEFEFLIVGEVHTDDPSLTITSFKVGRNIDETYTKYLVTTQMTNDNATINSSVQPSRAQDSYNVTQVDYDQVITNATGDSKATGANITGASKNDVIQGSNGIGIISTTPVSLTRVVIVRNEDDFDLKDSTKHQGKTNKTSSQILGTTFGAGQCLLKQFAGANAYDSNGDLYWIVTYEILISDDPSFFEKKYINRGVLDATGKPAPIASGYISDTEYKLDEAGEFLSLADQKDSTKYSVRSFPVLGESSWNTVVRLGSSPNNNILTLTGSSGFGLVNSGSNANPNTLS